MALALLPASNRPPEGAMIWTPNRVTFLRVIAGFTAVSLFGHGAWLNLLAVALTVAAIALDALDGHLAHRKKMATPVGAQIDILGDRIIENLYFTYFAVVGMVSLWLPILFFARGAATDFLRGLALLSPVTVDAHAAIRAGAQTLAWLTALFCVLRGLPFFLEGAKLPSAALASKTSRKPPRGEAA